MPWIDQLTARSIRAALLLGLAAACGGPALGQEAQNFIEPPFSIWDVVLGMDVATIPEQDVSAITCGTNGGPMSTPLSRFEDFALCPPEPSGLHEVAFTYDDELDYVARALDAEYDVFRDGTSVFAHPVLVSLLVSDQGTAEGLRILTDPRIPDRERRRSVTLLRNFIAKYDAWGLDCQNLPLADGEQPVGTAFTKNRCTGISPDGLFALRLDSRYLRKPGQEGLNRETREVNSSYFESYSRMEMTRLPFQPTEPPGLAAP